MESDEIEEILARHERIEANIKKLRQENNELKKKFTLLNSKILKSKSVRNDKFFYNKIFLKIQNVI